MPFHPAVDEALDIAATVLAASAVEASHPGFTAMYIRTALTPRQRDIVIRFHALAEAARASHLAMLADAEKITRQVTHARHPLVRFPHHGEG
jgi:hypothetical protein